MNSKRSGSFVALSNLNLIADNSFKDVIKNYLDDSLYNTFYILSDSNRNKGYLTRLIDIMELSKKDGRLVFVPGSNEQILYYYIMYLLTGEYNSYADKARDYMSYDNLAIDIEKLSRNNPKLLLEFSGWLGNLPLQRVHEYENENYGIAYSMFDYELYNSNKNISLADYYNMCTGLDKRMKNILWSDGCNRTSIPSIISAHESNSDNIISLNSKDEIAIFDSFKGEVIFYSPNSTYAQVEEESLESELYDIILLMLKKYNNDVLRVSEHLFGFIRIENPQFITRSYNCRARMIKLTSDVGGFDNLEEFIKSLGGVDTIVRRCLEKNKVFSKNINDLLLKFYNISITSDNQASEYKNIMFSLPDYDEIFVNSVSPDVIKQLEDYVEQYGFSDKKKTYTR